MATRKKATTKKQTQTDAVVEQETLATENTESVGVLGTQIEEKMKTNKDKLVGKTISLNQKNGPFFGIGDLWLNNTNYHAEVPDNLTEHGYQLVMDSLKSGKIVLGKIYIPPVDKDPSVITQAIKIVKEKPRSEVVSYLRQLIKVENKGGYTPVEIISECMNAERNSRNRKEIVELLSDTLQLYKGPVTLYTPPDNETDIKKVTFDSSGKATVERMNGEVENLGHVRDVQLAAASKEDLDAIFE